MALGIQIIKTKMKLAEILIMCEAFCLLERHSAVIFSKFPSIKYTTNGIVLCFPLFGMCSRLWIHACCSHTFCMHKRKFKLNQIKRIIQQNGLCEAEFEANLKRKTSDTN